MSALEPDVAWPASSYRAPVACANLLNGLMCADTEACEVVHQELAPPSLASAADRPCGEYPLEVTVAAGFLGAASDMPPPRPPENLIILARTPPAAAGTTSS